MPAPRPEPETSAPGSVDVGRGSRVPPVPAASGVPSGRGDALTLYLVRHGRTRFNTEHRLQGWSDSALTEDGRTGVEATGRALSGLRFDAAYASPSGRTLATAGAILDHHPAVPLRHDDGLRELHFGDDEEQLEAEVFARTDPREVFGGILTGRGPGFPGGEGGREYLSRVARAFVGIEETHAAGESVLVVSHGLTLMTYLMLGTDAALYPLANASVSVVEVAAGGVRSVRLLGHDPSGVGNQRTSEPLPGSPLRMSDVLAW